MMKKYIYICLLATFVSGCLTEIDFNEGDGAVIISGVLTNSEDERNIYITRSEGIKADQDLLKASGIIYKNGNPVAELSQQEAGVLSLPPSFKIEEGATYFVEVTTFDNQVYQSFPQTVPEQSVTDSISFEIVEHEASINENGEISPNYFIDFYAHITLPEPKDTAYYKWQIDQSWNFVSDARICYKAKSVEENKVAILSSAGRPKGPFKIRIASQEMDVAFSYKHYFNVHLYMMNKQNYKFYEKVQRLTENTGNLYDEIPAPFKGNVFLESGENETVLGNIEFSLSGDLLRFPIDSFMINERIDFLRVCEDKVNECPLTECYFPCSLPCSCFDCLISPRGDTIPGWNKKPDYFID